MLKPVFQMQHALSVRTYLSCLICRHRNHSLQAVLSAHRAQGRHDQWWGCIRDRRGTSGWRRQHGHAHYWQALPRPWHWLCKPGKQGSDPLTSQNLTIRAARSLELLAESNFTKQCRGDTESGTVWYRLCPFTSPRWLPPSSAAPSTLSFSS